MRCASLELPSRRDPNDRRERGFDSLSDSDYPTPIDSDQFLGRKDAERLSQCRSRRSRNVRALSDAPSNSAILLARVAVVLVVGLLILEVAWYGVTAESLGRLWGDILDRPGGPMTFRFILQPAMAVIAALRDGVKDARLGRTPYVWALIRGVRGPEGRAGRLWDGIISTARILILGVVMDIIYQWRVLGTFYPVQAAVIAILLAFVPYLLLRGPIARVAHHRVARAASSLSR
jgi:hypothetical protein